jgi:L-histidine N-alpha-methyltransferase
VTVEVHLDAAEARAAMLAETRTGLTAEPRWLPPLWFYDDRGSALFDEITRLPEYYPTRAETRILEDNAAKIVQATPATTLAELGSGTSTKTRLLLDAMRDAGRLERFVALDVSEATLRQAADCVQRDYGIPVQAVVGDFNSHVDRLPDGGPTLLAFLGGTIGNLDPPQRARLLSEVTAVLGPDDGFLLGTDLVKEPERLVAAYDDAAGVTAAFNRNVLVHLNRELGSSFDPAEFDHVAAWNAEERWIEMRLRSRRTQLVPVPALDLEVGLAAGEHIRSEISAKFTPDQIAAELDAAGLAVVQSFTDPDGDFLLTLAIPGGGDGRRVTNE